jgi:hypothetical protein
VIAHDFSSRLTAFNRWRRKTYSLGFAHGFVAAIVGVAFFAWYLWVGIGK